MVEHLQSGDQTMAPEYSAWQAIPHFCKIGCIMSTVAGGGGGGGGVFSTSWDTMSTLVDIMSTLGDVQYIGGYHDACGEQIKAVTSCSTHKIDQQETAS